MKRLILCAIAILAFCGIFAQAVNPSIWKGTEGQTVPNPIPWYNGGGCGWSCAYIDSLITAHGGGTSSFNGDSVLNYAWGLTGNTGTHPATNFIGTTDYSDLILKRNGNNMLSLATFSGVTGVLVKDSLGHIIGAFGSNNSDGIRIGLGDVQGAFNHTSFAINVAQRIITLSDSITHCTGKVSITDGTQANGYVLTSDASGNASWLQPQWVDSANFLFPRNGTDFVGIGTNAPQVPFEVDGDVILAAGGHSVGINTNTPSATLSVNGSGGFNGNLTVGGGGMLGINTASPSVLLDVEGGSVSPSFKLVDGTQGAGNVLTSDASGNASWQPVSGGGVWTESGSSLYPTTIGDFVGIGTTSPQVNFEVAGQSKLIANNNQNVLSYLEVDTTEIPYLGTGMTTSGTYVLNYPNYGKTFDASINADSTGIDVCYGVSMNYNSHEDNYLYTLPKTAPTAGQIIIADAYNNAYWGNDSLTIRGLAIGNTTDNVSILTILNNHSNVSVDTVSYGSFNGGLIESTYNGSGSDNQILNIVATGSQSGNWGSAIAFYTRPNGGSLMQDVVRITNVGNVYLTQPASGFILTDANGACWLYTASITTGALVPSSIACPSH